MFRSPVITTLVCSSLLLLSACAALPERPAAVDTPATASASSEAEIRIVWLDDRAHIEAQMGAAYGIETQTMDDGALLLRLPAADGFERNSAVPAAALLTMLDGVAQVLSGMPETALKVLGHTDSSGSELYNLQLSIARAEAVMEHLRSRGIALGRLSADGRGEAEPIADNATGQGRATNRRVEIIVRPFH